TSRRGLFGSPTWSGACRWRKLSGVRTVAAALKKRVYLEIAEWLARDRGIATTLEGAIERETLKAVLIDGVWVPRSAIRRMEVLEVVRIDAGPQLCLRNGQLLWSCPFEH